jgi:hypothetical protein
VNEYVILIISLKGEIKMNDQLYRKHWLNLKAYLRQDISDAEKRIKETDKMNLEILQEVIPIVEICEYILEIMNEIETDGLEKDTENSIKGYIK